MGIESEIRPKKKRWGLRALVIFGVLAVIAWVTKEEDHMTQELPRSFYLMTAEIISTSGYRCGQLSKGWMLIYPDTSPSGGRTVFDVTCIDGKRYRVVSRKDHPHEVSTR